MTTARGACWSTSWRSRRQIPGNHRATAWGYAMLSDLHHRLGEPDLAARALAQARDLFRALGAIDGPVGSPGVRVAAKRS